MAKSKYTEFSNQGLHSEKTKPDKPSKERDEESGEEYVKEEYDTEWFPKYGKAKCIRGVPIPKKEILKHKKMHEKKINRTLNIQEAFGILEKLADKEFAGLKVQEVIKKGLKKKERRRISHKKGIWYDKSSEDLQNNAKTNRENFASETEYSMRKAAVIGCPASQCKQNSTHASPILILDELHRYGLIDTFMRLLPDRERSKKRQDEIQKIEKKLQKLSYPDKVAEKNYEKDIYLYEEYLYLLGTGEIYYKINDNGKKTIAEFYKDKEDDPLAWFKDEITRSS